MGTQFSCQYSGSMSQSEIHEGVDSLLELVNLVASTYIPTSFISLFNQSEQGICLPAKHIWMHHMNSVMKLSGEVYEVSDGFFDPTLMPLVNYWGFGYEERIKKYNINRPEIDSILTYIGFEKIKTTTKNDSICLKKMNPNMELDLSAIAKGYAVDLIADYLGSKGADNYYINIGGEVAVKGVNSKGTAWTLGINYPDTAAGLQELYTSIKLKNGAMATSGNYRNYYAAGGKHIAHTINPKNGLASPSDLKSVTIVASTCAVADAYATACMAMGYGRARALVEAHSDLEGFFIYTDPSKKGLQHFATPQLKSKLNLTE